MDIVDPRIEAYMEERLRRFDEPVLLEMEADADANGASRSSAATSASRSRCSRASVGAERIMELGSGFGYSAYWFARAVGPDGEVHLHRRRPGERDREPPSYLKRAGLGDRVKFHVGDARRRFDAAGRRVRHRLQRHRQGRLPGRLARRQRADPPRRPLRLRQRALVRARRGRGPGRRAPHTPRPSSNTTV